MSDALDRGVAKLGAARLGNVVQNKGGKQGERGEKEKERQSSVLTEVSWTSIPQTRVPSGRVRREESTH